MGPFSIFGPNIVHNPDHQSYGGFGSVLSAGDFDGDGRADLLVGESSWTSQYSSQGAAMLYRWTTSGTWAQVGHYSYSPEANGNYGYAVGWTDINGDGTDELLIGKPGDSTGGVSGQGSVWWLKMTNAGGVASTTRLAYPSLPAQSRFGVALY